MPPTGEGGADLPAPPPNALNQLALGPSLTPPPFSLTRLVREWPELDSLRSAASSHRVRRCVNTIESIISSLRVALAGAFLAAQATSALNTPLVLAAVQRHQWCRALIKEAPYLRIAWRLPDELSVSFTAALQSTVHWRDTSYSHRVQAHPTPDDGGGLRPFPHSLTCFLACLAAGWNARAAIHAWATLPTGRFSTCGPYIEAQQFPPAAGSLVELWTVPGSASRPAFTVGILDSSIVFIHAPQALTVPRLPAGSTGTLAACLHRWGRM